MIENYNELIESIVDELERDDLVSKVPEWIALAEASLGRFVNLIDGEFVTTGTTVPDDPQLIFPVGFKKAVSIILNTNPLRALSIVDWTKRADVLINDLTGIPRAISFSGKIGYLAPVPATAIPYDLVYYGRPPRLSESNQTNDLLDMGPDVLKYEALKYSAPYLVEDERLMTWEAINTTARITLKREYWDSHVGGGILRVRPDFAPRDSHNLGANS